MSSIVLSICIATYNRAAFIGATLQQLLPQMTAEMEVVIVDGASPDSTESVVRRYQSSCPQIRYIRLSSNGGFDKDYNTAVEAAQGEYCWLMSDDDLLKQGALKAILREIRRGYPLIVVNAEIRDASLAKLLSPRRLSLLADRVYGPEEANRHCFLAEVGDYLSFIGCVVIQRALWLSRNKDAYFGTLFVHVGVIFQSPIPGPILVIAEPWIVIRSGNAQWTGRHCEIWLSLWPKLIWSFPDYADWAKNHVCSNSALRRLWHLILFRAIGAYTIAEYRKWLMLENEPRWTRALAKLVALAPGCAVNAAASLYARTRRSAPLAYRLSISRFYWRKCAQRLALIPEALKGIRLRKPTN